MKRTIFSLILFLTLLSLPAMAEKRVALVIGNSAYGKIGKLENPVRDAKLMGRVLKRQGFEVILGLDLDYRSMKRMFRRYAKILRTHGTDTVGFLFYAGHGLQVRGINYLVPVGAEIENEGDAEIEAISASSVLFGVREAGNRLNIIVLDACRNNPYRSMFRSGTRGLATMNAPRGALVAFSTGPGDVAADGAGRNSPFTRALASSLQRPGLTIERVFKRARRKVFESSNEKQLPWVNSSVLGDFYPAGKTKKKSVPVSDEGREIAYWQEIKGSKDPADYADYLQQFPKGTFVSVARRMRKKYESGRNVPMREESNDKSEKLARRLGLPLCQKADTRIHIYAWEPDVNKKKKQYYIKTEPPQGNGKVVYISFHTEDDDAHCSNAKPDKLYSFSVPDNLKAFPDGGAGGLAVNLRGNVQYAQSNCYFSGFYLNKPVFGMHQGWIETYFEPIETSKIMLSGNFCLAKASG